MPEGVTTIGGYFRNSQYLECTSLTAPAAEVLPESVTTIGGNFRSSQYSGCSSMLIGGHIHSKHFAALLNSEGNYKEMFSLFPYQIKVTPDTVPHYYTGESEGATAPVTDCTPTAFKGYMTNRTGIADYADLNAYWTAME